jgi:hypothetical protein
MFLQSRISMSPSLQTDMLKPNFWSTKASSIIGYIPTK